MWNLWRDHDVIIKFRQSGSFCLSGMEITDTRVARAQSWRCKNINTFYPKSPRTVLKISLWHSNPLSVLLHIKWLQHRCILLLLFVGNSIGYADKTWWSTWNNLLYLSVLFGPNLPTLPPQLTLAMIKQNILHVSPVTHWTTRYRLYYA